MFVRSRFIKGKGITTNLYTKGGEYADPQKLHANNYVGPYHMIHGKVFKGDMPEKMSWKYPLIKICRINQNFQYNELKKQDFARPFKGVVSNRSLITEQDETRGWFYRYVAIYLPSQEIIEIDEEQYHYLQKKKTPHHRLYNSAFLKWKISGPIFDKYIRSVIDEYGIIDTNRRSIGIVEDTIPRLSTYFNDLMQFSQPYADYNLSTDGEDFEDQDGVPYSGKYHVHREYGVMKGAYHTDKPHELLRAIAYINPPKRDDEKMIQTPQLQYNAIRGK